LKENFKTRVLNLDWDKAIVLIITFVGLFKFSL
jgi:hypothetical protein